jgi:hypothetical protein
MSLLQIFELSEFKCTAHSPSFKVPCQNGLSYYGTNEESMGLNPDSKPINFFTTVIYELSY